MLVRFVNTQQQQPELFGPAEPFPEMNLPILPEIGSLMFTPRSPFSFEVVFHKWVFESSEERRVQFPYVEVMLQRTAPCPSAKPAQS